MNKFVFILIFWIRFLFRIFNSKSPDIKFIKENKYLIDYYIKIENKFSLNNEKRLCDVKLNKQEGYNYEFYSLIYPYRKFIIFKYLPGDVKHVPSEPTFVKSRPINCDNRNSVILPLNTVRHFKFLKDKTKFTDKKNKIVWRGAAYQENRKRFLDISKKYCFIDSGNTAINMSNKSHLRENYLSIKKQLEFKFIVSLEGNDVASNLKWIMSSNSVCIMPKPNYETWFREGMLVSGFHYIEVENDFSNIEEKFLYYLDNVDECIKISRNANNYCHKFKNKNYNRKLARAVTLKYNSLIDA